MKERADMDYLDKFFGDASGTSEMTDAELRHAIAKLRREWTWDGDYTVGIDPPSDEIFQATREIYPIQA
uniref:Uncharacterized protein n=1 Tax=viral metagenome TaxID=1070528 RepID=A0A6M3LNT9_9ZZZZ